jgi:hypothetical protein
MASLLMPPGASASESPRNTLQGACVSTGGRSILMARLLRSCILAERRRNRQSDRADDCEERNAGCRSQTSGAEHEHSARVANFQLVQQRIAFDNEKSESGDPDAQSHEHAAHAMRW